MTPQMGWGGLKWGTPINGGAPIWTPPPNMGFLFVGYGERGAPPKIPGMHWGEKGPFWGSAFGVKKGHFGVLLLGSKRALLGFCFWGRKGPFGGCGFGAKRESFGVLFLG